MAKAQPAKKVEKKPAASGFGARLKARRKAEGAHMTQKRLAALVDFDPMTISRVERDKQPPSSKLLKELNEVLGSDWMTPAERQFATERRPALDDADELSPFEHVKHDELYTTARPLVRAHYDVGLARVPSNVRTRAEQIAFYKEWLVSLRSLDRAGTLGPVNALRSGDTVDPEID